jgi:hypothetical protein
VDIWTSKQRLGYMAVTLHVLNQHGLLPKLMERTPAYLLFYTF